MGLIYRYAESLGMITKEYQDEVLDGWSETSEEARVEYYTRVKIQNLQRLKKAEDVVKKHLKTLDNLDSEFKELKNKKPELFI